MKGLRLLVLYSALLREVSFFSGHSVRHDPEPTTLLCSCNVVFTDRFIFRLNFPVMRLPQEPDDQLQEIKLTS